MDHVFSQMQQFTHGFTQLWQDQVGRATEAAFSAQRAWLEQCQDLYSRMRVTDDVAPSVGTPSGPRG